MFAATQIFARVNRQLLSAPSLAILRWQAIAARDLAFLQRADVGGQFLGQHRHDAVGEIDAVAARPRFAVELGAGADVETDVGDGDDRVPAALLSLVVRRGPDGVVMVAGIGGVDGDDRQMSQVLALAELLLGDTRCASSIASCRNSWRRPCLWMAIRLKLRGANGSPSTASTRAVTRGGRPGHFAQHEVARLGVLQVG